MPPFPRPGYKQRKRAEYITSTDFLFVCGSAVVKRIRGEKLFKKKKAGSAIKSNLPSGGWSQMFGARAGIRAVFLIRQAIPALHRAKPWNGGDFGLLQVSNVNVRMSKDKEKRLALA